MRTLRMEPLVHNANGTLMKTDVPVIPADASPALREGLRRRRVAAGVGRCPCGARRQITAVTMAGADQGVPQHMPFDHRPDCPAHDDQLRPHLEAWQAQNGGARRGAQTR